MLISNKKEQSIDSATTWMGLKGTALWSGEGHRLRNCTYTMLPEEQDYRDGEKIGGYRGL